MLAVVGAHPDDAELGAGGILAAHKGLIISCTNGQNHARDPEIAEKEQERSAKILGCPYIIMGNPEIWTVNHALVSQLDQIFTDMKVTAVLTHAPDDSNQEHYFVSRAVLAASRRLDDVLYFESTPVARSHFQPQMYFDITETKDAKYRAINMYKSQVSRLGRNLITTRKALDRWRGEETGVEYAESFMVERYRLN